MGTRAFADEGPGRSRALEGPGRGATIGRSLCPSAGQFSTQLQRRLTGAEGPATAGGGTGTGILALDEGPVPDGPGTGPTIGVCSLWQLSGQLHRFGGSPGGLFREVPSGGGTGTGYRPLDGNIGPGPPLVDVGILQFSTEQTAAAFPELIMLWLCQWLFGPLLHIGYGGGGGGATVGTCG